MKTIDILLVEDNEGDILLTREAFSEWHSPNQINVVRDGQEAIDFLSHCETDVRRHTPDLVLLDVNLPRKNGIDVLRFIKGAGKLKHIPVIMLTTSSSAEDIKLAYNNYVNCYITKPDEADTFQQVVSAIESFWISVARLPSNT